VITHVAVFRWKPGTEGARVAAFSAALDEMVPRIPAIRSYRHGRDIAATDGTWDYAVVAEVDDVDALRAYLDHPAHVEVTERHLVGILDAVVRVQIDGGA
jgi:hypothetical protein